jgi:uncharacterized protein YcaQ
MTHHRVNLERAFDLHERIAPAGCEGVAGVEAAERFLIRKAIAWLGLARPRSLGGLLERRVPAAEAAAWAQALTANGDVLPVRVEGLPDTYYALAEDAPLLEAVAAGRVPRAWRPLGPTTNDEVTLLAPLEIVSTRGRAQVVFGFEYLWEVYKPVERRRWGYYTLPVLYGDQLVARLDPWHDRAANRLEIRGLWLEEANLASDAAFAQALAAGLAGLLRLSGAERLDVAAVHPARLRRHLATVRA